MSKKKKKKKIRSKAVVKKHKKTPRTSPSAPVIVIDKPHIQPIKEEKVKEKEKTVSSKFSFSTFFDFKLIWIITIVFALEIFFKFFTGSLLLSLDYVYIILFSISYGSLIYFILSFFRKKYLYFTVLLIILLVIGTLFFANDLIHSQFKVFYDTKTVLAGAKDVIAQFRNEIKAQVLNLSSAKKLFMYLLPIVLFSISFLRNKFTPVNRHQAFVSLYVLVISFALATNFLYLHPQYERVYRDEYNFTNAINDFGLLSALRLDTTRRSEEVSFTEVFEEEPTPTPEIIEEVVEEEKIIYEDNVLDIDFESLKAGANYIDLQLDEYVSSLTPSKTNKYTGLFEGKNLIMITAEAFSKEVIDPKLTPTLYRLATKGINFKDYYQPTSAGTTGGEYEVLFGALPTSGGLSLKNTQYYHNTMTIASQLDRLGYEGWAFHNNDYGFYDRHLTHNNLGYSNDYMGIGNGMEEYVQYVWPESDLEMIEGTFPLYADEDKFNVYYMTVSGHSGYNIDENKMASKNYDKVKDLDYSDRVKGYLAANLELENALAYLVEALEKKGIADDTVIVLTADHFPYGLDDSESLYEQIYLSELYGYQVTNYLERDHNALIIWSASLEEDEPIIVNTPVSSLDILPTLSNLFNTKWDSRLFVGRDVFSNTTPLVFNVNYDWKTDKGYYLSGEGRFYPIGEENVDEEYIENMRNIVKNKIIYCQLYNQTDYFNHLFPDGLSK